VLVGRDAERRAIGDLLAGARVGSSGVLLLSGEPGIGKTALLEDAVLSAGSMQVLRAHGIESETSLAFAGLLDVLRPLLRLLGDIPAPQARALEVALLLQPPAGQEPSRFAVGAATLSLLSRAAEDRPVVVLVDDAHLMDEPSAQAIAFAARRLVTDAVAMLVTVRPDGPGADVWTSLPRLVVGGLDLVAASELVAERCGGEPDPRSVGRLHRATAGNPLALLELAHHAGRLDWSPPDSPLAVSAELTRRFVGRLDELGPSSRLALIVASADSSSLAAVHRACRELGVADGALAEAETAGLVTVSRDQVSFRHPLVRSAVYGSADPATRRAVHGALAAVLPEGEVDRLAWHLSEGSLAPDEPVARTLDLVAQRASGRGAYATAASAYERAAQLTLDEISIARLLAAAGEAAWLSGSAQRALELLGQALDSTTDPLRRAHVQELQGAVQTRSGSLDDALATLLHAADGVATSSADTAVRLLSDAVHVCFYLGDPVSAADAAGRIERLLGSTTEPRTRFHAAMARGMTLILGGAGDQGVAQLRRAVELAPDPGEVGADQFRLPRQVLAALWLRETGAARRMVDGAVGRLREQAALGVLPYLLMHVARDDATTDRWDDAEAEYLEAIRLAAESGQSTDRAASMAGLAWLYARQGRAHECRDLVVPAQDLCATNHIRVGTAWLEFALGDLESGTGDPAKAAAHYRALEQALGSTGVSDPDLSPAPELVECWLQQGRATDAVLLAEQFGAKAVAKGQPWSVARAERTFGLCSTDATGEVHFTRALDVHQRTPDRYETARTELAYGSWLRRRRRRVDARGVLQSALTGFETLGAVPWADKAARELEATGITAQRRAAGVVGRLTPQERQIAQLLAQGRTTREAAAALFLSPKTVEYHLRHVYLKLGIRSRAALAEAFTEGAVGSG
jgi:DNA-binding CsgD family transcriptional regulator/tetratricopeptide (TPR) repeat protein